VSWLLFRKCLKNFRGNTNSNIQRNAQKLKKRFLKNGGVLTEEDNKLTIGEWAWKYHPQTFQYSKAYVRLSSSSSRGTPGAVAGEDNDDDDDDDEEEILDEVDNEDNEEN
jgi:hypothetical protein